MSSSRFRAQMRLDRRSLQAAAVELMYMCVQTELRLVHWLRFEIEPFTFCYKRIVALHYERL